MRFRRIAFAGVIEHGRPRLRTGVAPLAGDLVLSSVKVRSVRRPLTNVIALTFKAVRPRESKRSLWAKTPHLLTMCPPNLALPTLCSVLLPCPIAEACARYDGAARFRTWPFS